MQMMDRIEEMRGLQKGIVSLLSSILLLNKISRLTSGHERCLGRIADDDSGRSAHR